MKKFNYRGFLGVGLLVSMASLSAGCLTSGDDETVSYGTLCVTFTGAPPADLDGIIANVKVRWEVYGDPFDSDAVSEPLTITLDADGYGCIYKKLGFSRSMDTLKSDIEVLDVLAKLTDSQGNSLSGADHAPDVSYNSDNHSLKVRATIALSKVAQLQSPETRAVRKLLGKGRIKIVTDKVAFKGNEKRLSDDVQGSSKARSTSGSAQVL